MYVFIWQCKAINNFKLKVFEFLKICYSWIFTIWIIISKLTCYFVCHWMGPSSLIESWEKKGNSENSFRNHVLKTGPTCSQHIWPMQILPQPKSTKWTPPSPPLPCLIRHSTRYNVFRVFPVFWVLGVFRVTKTNIQSFQVFRVFRVWL